jgi:hypothetical protein
MKRANSRVKVEIGGKTHHTANQSSGGGWLRQQPISPAKQKLSLGASKD